MDIKYTADSSANRPIGWSTRELALIATLAAFSVVVQLIHIGYYVPQFGIWIDMVAVSWIIAIFLLGIRSVFFVSLLSACIIALFSPATWLGAAMKWVTTAPMWLTLYSWLWCVRYFKIRCKPACDTYRCYEDFHNLILPLLVALVLRALVAMPLNYYFAIPLWTGMSASQAKAAIPWYAIVGLNVVQGTLEVVLAWVVTFRFNLKRFANWGK